jgi:hypothetical protein
MTTRKAALAVAALLAAAAVQPATGRAAEPSPRRAGRPHVVVATLDTGTNPFHPSWRRGRTPHPSRVIPGYPSDATPLKLAFDGTFADNVQRSAAVLADVGERGHYWIPGTNIVGLWASENDGIPIFDPAAGAGGPGGFYTHAHGASASSQIAGLGFGLAPDAYLVVLDRTPDAGSGASGGIEGVAAVHARGLMWAADQPWIDVIHTNIQNPIPLADDRTPGLPSYPEAVRYAVEKGKLVVAAGGNFYAEPTETSPHAGPRGTLVVGANDNCGYTDYSNPNPHVVMDGYGTVAAEPAGEGETTFSGTSSASPRTTGYAADLLLRIRQRYGYTGGIDAGALVRVPEGRRPESGPLADGALTAAELHEVIRKTASPTAHESQWDGSQGIDGVVGAGCIPAPPAGFYPKMGYGEVSEHTIDAAFAVATGAQPMPERAVEDMFYEMSEQLRAAFWD